MLNFLPSALIYLRFLLGPVILLLYFFSPHVVAFGVVLTIGFLSDFADGVLARRLGVSTPALRSLDSWADTVFYVCVFLTALLAHFDSVQRYTWLIAVLIFLELSRHIFEQKKFGKSASYHMWSAKLWGLFLYLGFMQLLVFGEAGVFFVTAIVLGIVSDVEGLLASILLPTWQSDIPSVWHVWKRRR